MSSNMKDTMMETFNKFGGLGVTTNSQNLFVTEVLNNFYDNGLIDGETYEKAFPEDVSEEEVVEKTEDEEFVDSGKPPRGVGPVPVEERPITATAELVEEKVVEETPEEVVEETPKKEKKSKIKSKKKSKKKFGWLGE